MKRMLGCIVCFVLIILFGVRVWYINRDIALPPVLIYEIGEEVPIEENYFLTPADGNMNGYSITVNSTEMFSYDEYLQKYGYSEDEHGALFEKDDLLYPEMVYDLYVTVKNTNTTADPTAKSGINFHFYNLVTTDYLLQISSPLYQISNSSLAEGMMSFSLRPESEMNFHLPFYFSPSGIYAPIKIDEVLNDDLYLVLSLYPNQLQISLR